MDARHWLAGPDRYRGAAFALAPHYVAHGTGDRHRAVFPFRSLHQIRREADAASGGGWSPKFALFFKLKHGLAFLSSLLEEMDMYEQYSALKAWREWAPDRWSWIGMGWMTRCSKSRLIRKSLIALACMLSTSGAMATSYFIVDGYENTAMCRAVRKALSDGMVLDAEQPLCERRFELRPQAKSLGLSGIEKRLLPSISYMDIWLKMAQLEGGESMPPSDDDKKRDEIIISKNMKIGVNNIYESHFDADNSGKIQKVYIVDDAMCNVDNLSDYYPDDSVTTYIVKKDGTFDARWGAHAATAGIPFIFKGHTYYMKWESLKGNPDKHMLAQLDVFDAIPFHPELKDVVPDAGFTPPYCEIYAYKAR